MRLKKPGIKLRYVFLLLAAVLLLGNRGFRTLVRNYLEYRRLGTRKIELERERVRLQKELGTTRDPAAIERSARRDLGMQRPGEIEYRFPPPSGTGDKP